MATLGHIYLADYTISQLENAVKRSFEARRGKFYNALRALNAFAIMGVARGAVDDEFSDRNVEELVWRALQEQMEKELEDEFRFLHCYNMGMWKFRDARGAVEKLEPLVPQFVAEFNWREADGSLERKRGLVRWCLGIEKTGSIEELLAFARESISFAIYAFDEDSRFPDLEDRIYALEAQLPEW